VIAPARRVAFDLLCRIELCQAHSDDALRSAAVDELAERDRHLVTEITYGTLRWRAWLDCLLAAAVVRSWESVDQKTRVLLRLSLYQLARMDRVPDHAAINDAVNLAKAGSRPDSAGFVNGVLRALARQRPWTMKDFHRDCPMWARVSLPQWLWKRWEARFGRDLACEYALSLNQPPAIAFRTEGVVDERVVLPRSELVPGAHVAVEWAQALEADSIRVQDEASQLVPYLFGPLDGAIAWDACAAPGGKSAILREMCGPAGRVVSSDLDPERARRMRGLIERAGGAPSDVLAADALRDPPFRHQFDAVLADVPCTGLGTLRRNPEIKWRMQPDRLWEMGRKQRRILDALAPAVRPGGRLLYSTCSTEPEENELVVGHFLASHPGFRIRRPSSPPGIDAWLDEQGMFRSYPSPRPWDGFFATLMECVT
jgi:16S rRNA (cytosine967-C5)-methyltransferase